MTPAIDDDAHWLSIEAACQQRAERISNNELAVIDLMEALTHGGLPCMARSTATGERKPIASAEWADQIELRFWKGRMRVFSRQPSVRMIARRPTKVREEVRGWVFYVGKQAFETLWPAKLTDGSSEVPGSRQPVQTPRPPQQEATQTAKGTIKDQVVAAFDQMETKATNRSQLARELAQRIGKPKSWGYIRKELAEWGLWQKRPGREDWAKRPRRRKFKPLKDRA